MWTGLVTWWSNSKVAQFMTWALVALVGWETVKRHIKEEAKKAERSAIAKRQAEAQAAVSETRRELEVKRTDDAQRAEQAAHDLPRYPDAASLRNDRPDLAAIVFGDAAGRDGSSKGS